MAIKPIFALEYEIRRSDEDPLRKLAFEVAERLRDSYGKTGTRLIFFVKSPGPKQVGTAGKGFASRSLGGEYNRFI